MSLFSTIKSWFSSEEPEVEVKVDHTETFIKVCAAQGLGQKYLDQSNAVELFREWYEGDGSEQDILNSIPAFMEQHPIVNAKFVRFFRR